MRSVSPVFTDRELDSEQVIALSQKEYYPIIVARVIFQDNTIASLIRIRLTDKERELVTRGADIILSQPHHGSMMPMGIQIAFPDEYPIPEEDLI